MVSGQIESRFNTGQEDEYLDIEALKAKIISADGKTGMGRSSFYETLFESWY